jgi:hypothetical protein
MVSPLGVLVALILVSTSDTVLLWVISSSSQVVIVSVFSFIFGIIRLVSRIFHIQLFKSLNLLNGRGLKKVNVEVWLSWWRNN